MCIVSTHIELVGAMGIQNHRQVCLKSNHLLIFLSGGDKLAHVKWDKRFDIMGSGGIRGSWEVEGIRGSWEDHLLDPALRFLGCHLFFLFWSSKWLSNVLL